MIYLFDGTFEGLLTCVFTSFENKERPTGVIPERSIQKSFTEEYIHIPTELDKYDRVFSAMRKKSPQALHTVYNAYLADSIPGKDTTVFGCICLFFEHGTKIKNMLQNEHVLGVNKLYHKVYMQSCKLKGFLRFEELAGNILYAKINPTDNILELLASHFADRFTNQNFIIFDEVRNLYAVYNTRRWIITELEPSELPQRTEDEEQIQKMWKRFIEIIAIKERTNPKLQRQLMPKKYWENMFEFKEVPHAQLSENHGVCTGSQDGRHFLQP